MHLLTAKPGGFTDDEGIVDLDQSAGDIVILSAADSSLAALATAVESVAQDYPQIRLANWMQLLKPAAFDLYQHKVLDHATVIVVSLLGGQSYWQYACERLLEWADQTTVEKPRHLILVPGDDSPDPALFEASSAPVEDIQRIWRYLREGGAANNQQLLHFIAARYLHKDYVWREPQLLPRCMLYMPDSSNHHSQATYNEWLDRWQRTNPDGETVLLLFYRSHLQSASTVMFDQLIEALERQGINPLPIAISSLKDPESISLVNALLDQSRAGLILNTTGFASQTVSSPDLAAEPTRFQSPFSQSVPVFQLILSSSTEQDWQSYSQGLRSRDIAMQVVLPEMDGRIITRAVSFKSEAFVAERSEIPVVKYSLHHERAEFVASLANGFLQLAKKPNQQKRIALILANYPTRDGRIGNGVGLDTPASVINILQAMKDSGYPVENVPENGNQLIIELLGAITNNPETLRQLPCWQSISVEEYLEHFHELPESAQQAVLTRWGDPQQDPKCREQRLMIAGIRLGETFVGIQPARGFNVDLAANYHDPDLVPPHSYLAFYFWLRHQYRVDAVIHVGKHGNLEWLPGKGNGLSNSCWPDIALGPMPHFYPFIVNDPGEGAQAKRRAQAVIIDHLMPPMTRAETYGELTELEALVDEYYQALGMDERREQWLRKEILNLVQKTRVYDELTLSKSAGDDEVLVQLDTWLCDIKEAQIRHGLHILGELPQTHKLVDTLVALLRLPRGESPQAQGILHSLVNDLDLCCDDDPFDPLNFNTDSWAGKRPGILLDVTDSNWRTGADTRERLELLAIELVSSYLLNPDVTIQLPQLPATSCLLEHARGNLMQALHESAEKEIASLLTGLEGGFIDPGPSGAPTRGRLDTLPTGRNFFSVDNRSIPSVAAWALGKQSAQALIERHLQDHGDYPRQMGLSVWGTATMRTGGDDIAQAFALMGIKPIWAVGSQRVIDFEIVPMMKIGRPRVDVTLRVSGFFRDAFPNVMKLYDAAVVALSTFEEPGGMNSIRTHIDERASELEQQGLDAETARRQASYRVFGSKPGAYGAGLQGLIDERCWETSADLAQAYLNWGGYAYGKDKADADGVEAKQAFSNRLSQLEVVVHNQDNREHDILDSDDYYQFQGGMTNAVTELSGTAPAVYHNDHSNPSQPKVRTLKEELNRVIRSRVLNPKWISAMQEHGYKGAFEMAASVDYLFAYDATTNLIDDYQYALVSDAIVFDQQNQQFLKDNNPNALEEMAERLLEATQRGLWQEPGQYSERLQELLLDIDARQESMS
jgi:cobaltochelatase CobN